MSGQAIQVVIFLAIVAIVLIAIPAMGLPVPGFVYQICWVLFVAIVVIFAIKFLRKQE